MKEFDLLDAKKFENAVLKGLESVYVAELTMRTPMSGHSGEGTATATLWRARSLGNFEFSIENPNGNIIAFLEEGTKAHTIKPNTKKMLKFQIDKAPSIRNASQKKSFSKNGVLFFFNKQRQAVLGYSKEGGKYYCYAREVHHPGFEGQHFVRDILESEALINKFEQNLNEAFK